jgi:hypothetical protein
MSVLSSDGRTMSSELVKFSGVFQVTALAGVLARIFIPWEPWPSPR